MMILNRLIPADGKSSRYASWGIVLLALGQLCWLQLQPGSNLRQTWAAAVNSDASRAAVTEKESFDQIARHAGAGNILLNFAGAAKADAVFENHLCYVYYRCAYTLYPHRIFVGPADSTVNNGGDIMRIEFNPSRQWLQAHGVRSVLTFGNDQPGGAMLQMNFLQSPENEPAGAQTNRPGGN